MQIDRRITNGLAWAGAVLVVAIPAADFVLRQTMSEAPQVSVVSETTTRSEDVRPATEPSAASAEVKTTDPVVTATAARPAADSSDPVDRLLQSGREMPSYISGGNAASTPVTAPKPATPVVAKPAPAPASTAPATPAVATPAPAATPPATAVTPAAPQTAAVQPKPAVTLPTPVSQRPPSVAQVRPAPAPVPPAPLVVEEPDMLGIVTADDLDEWESGPLSEFLAGRRGASAPQADYSGEGFFLDEVPVNRREGQTFPRAYGEGFYYPFSD